MRAWVCVRSCEGGGKGSLKGRRRDVDALSSLEHWEPSIGRAGEPLDEAARGGQQRPRTADDGWRAVDVQVGKAHGE
eukprot:COSAG02_NODE_82_length_39723_cov_247.146650_17_plen_77_part_00